MCDVATSSFLFPSACSGAGVCYDISMGNVTLTTPSSFEQPLWSCECNEGFESSHNSVWLSLPSYYQDCHLHSQTFLVLLWIAFGCQVFAILLSVIRSLRGLPRGRAAIYAVALAFSFEFNRVPGYTAFISHFLSQNPNFVKRDVSSVGTGGAGTVHQKYNNNSHNSVSSEKNNLSTGSLSFGLESVCGENNGVGVVSPARPTTPASIQRFVIRGQPGRTPPASDNVVEVVVDMTAHQEPSSTTSSSDTGPSSFTSDYGTATKPSLPPSPALHGAASNGSTAPKSHMPSSQPDWDEKRKHATRILSSRGRPFIVLLTTVFMCLYFTGALFFRTAMMQVAETPFAIVFWICLFFAISGISYLAAIITLRLVAIASTRAFHRMSRGVDKSNVYSPPSTKRRLKAGRVLVVITFFLTECLIAASMVLSIYSQSSGSTLAKAASNTPLFMDPVHLQLLSIRLFAIGVAVACLVYSLNLVIAASFVINILQAHLRPTMSLGQQSDQLWQSLFQLKRLRNLGIFLAFSLCSTIVLFWFPASIDYIFPIIASSGSVLVSLGMLLDNGISSQHYRQSQKSSTASSSSWSFKKIRGQGVVFSADATALPVSISTPTGPHPTLPSLSLWRMIWIAPCDD